MIPYGKQQITDEDINSVIKVLKSDYLTQGPNILDFELKFSKYVGSDYAVAVSNGTAALHLCNLALELKPDDNVITTPITFSATPNSARYCGANIVFCDINNESYLIDLDCIERILQNDTQKKIKGIIPVNFAGRVVNLEKLKIIADKYKVWIVEDSCHSPGGFFIDSNGVKQNSGNGNFADLSIFSFHPVKHIATGEGGMITTNNKLLYNKLITLRTHGITKESGSFKNSISIASGLKNLSNDKYPAWYMEMHNLGYNYRLSDISAALGTSQLERAELNLNKRKKIAKKYYESFKNFDKIINQSGFIEGHAYHLYVIEVYDRLGLYNYLRKNNIFCQIHYIPCHLMPYYKSLGYNYGDFPKSETYYKNCISLPMFPSLTDSEQDFVIDHIFKYFEK